MPLPRYAWSLARIALAGITVALFAGCAKTPLIVDRNRPPRTFLVAAPIDSTISHPAATGVSYSYRVHIYWRGEDPDGYVVGFLWAFDDSSAGHLHYTTKTDSTFDLTVNDSTDITGGATIIGSTRFHTFFIKAVDNLGKADPNFAIFNRTTFKASTLRPSVRFVGSIPSLAARDSGRVDTLSDGQPFQIHWTGNDSDGVVIRYKIDVGSFSGPLTSDTTATFNGGPGTIGLASGIYNLTLTAVDNALAVGKTSLFFVVNHDPETWFEPKGAPNGFYRAPFVNGNQGDPNQAQPFFEGDTVPYRSTVWFNWDGEDLGRPGAPNNPLPESNCLNGFSLELRGGTRNNGQAYVIGFVDSIRGAPTRPFKSNEPGYLGLAGFQSFILDSLDAGFNMFLLAASRDCSNRGDGTKAAFRFNCNYRPFIDSLFVDADPGGSGPPDFQDGRLISWRTHDREDGVATQVKIKLDGFSTRTVTSNETADDRGTTFVADSTFARLAPSNPHSVEVWAIDRAGFQSDSSLVVFFDLVPPGPTKPQTRRP
jgi:hypothetical protein